MSGQSKTTETRSKTTGTTGSAGYPDTTVATANESMPVTTRLRKYFFEEPHFGATWENYEKVKQSVLEEYRDLWSKFSQEFEQARCMLEDKTKELTHATEELIGETKQQLGEGGEEVKDKTKQLVKEGGEQVKDKSQQLADKTKELVQGGEEKMEIDKGEGGGWFPRRWMFPSIPSASEVLRNLGLYTSHADQDVIRLNQDDKSLEVSLDTSAYRPSELKVHVLDDAVVIEGRHEEKSGDGNHHIVKQFHRRYRIPDGLTHDDVTSDLSADGVLVVKAQKAQAA